MAFKLEKRSFEGIEKEDRSGEAKHPRVSWKVEPWKLSVD